MSSLFGQSPQKRQRGQSMTEFALILPILLFTILAILDLGRVLFTYAQASNALRSAARYAEVLGYSGASVTPFLDCDGMEATAENIYFAEDAKLVVKYLKSDNSEMPCENNGDVQQGDLVDGDRLFLTLTARVEFIALPFTGLTLNFEAQRTIITSVQLMGGCPPDIADVYFCDADYDGLADGWEREHYDLITRYNATDDPDRDGCNNGCEEQYAGEADPLDASLPAGFTLETSNLPSLITPLNANNLAALPNPPARPSNFRATADCAAGTVDFTWDSMSPVAARALIREARTGVTVIELDADGPGYISNAFCFDCDTIQPGTGYREYYMIAYMGTPPLEVEGEPSEITSADCRSTAATPTSFSAAIDCTNRAVDFSWTWGGSPPLSARIFRADGTLVQEITDTSRAFCLDCDSWTDGSLFERSYYLIAYNGAEATYPSQPTSPVRVACDAPTMAIRVYLFGDQQRGGQPADWTYTAGVDQNFAGLGSDILVTIRNLANTFSQQRSLTIPAEGMPYTEFTNLPLDQYQITIDNGTQLQMGSGTANRWRLQRITGDPASIAYNNVNLPTNTILLGRATQSETVTQVFIYTNN